MQIGSTPWRWAPHLHRKVIFRNDHDDVIKWKHFPRYWPFVRGIHRSPVNSPHKGQWRRALMFTLICVWINGCVNNREAGDLRRYCAHYGVTVMYDPCPHAGSYQFFRTLFSNQPRNNTKCKYMSTTDVYRCSSFSQTIGHGMDEVGVPSCLDHLIRV